MACDWPSAHLGADLRRLVIFEALRLVGPGIAIGGLGGARRRRARIAHGGHRVGRARVPHRDPGAAGHGCHRGELSARPQSLACGSPRRPARRLAPFPLQSSVSSGVEHRKTEGGMRKLAAVLLAVALGVGPAAAAPPPWLEIKSRHFTVVTNAGEKSGRRAAWQMEQIRQALKLLWPWANIDGGLPITIFAARDKATLKTLGHSIGKGKRFRPASTWATGVDRQYIALRTDLAEPKDEGDNPYQTAYWNYVSLVFHRSLPPGTPEWYSRGVAEVLSNTDRAREGDPCGPADGPPPAPDARVAPYPARRVSRRRARIEVPHAGGRRLAVRGPGLGLRSLPDVWKSGSAQRPRQSLQRSPASGSGARRRPEGGFRSGHDALLPWG